MTCIIRPSTKNSGLNVPIIFFSIDKNLKIRQGNVVMNNIGDFWFVSPETEWCQKVHNICSLWMWKVFVQNMLTIWASNFFHQNINIYNTFFSLDSHLKIHEQHYSALFWIPRKKHTVICSCNKKIFIYGFACQSNGSTSFCSSL